MFSKLKSGFWYWVNFSSAFWEFYVETCLIVKYSVTCDCAHARAYVRYGFPSILAIVYPLTLTNWSVTIHTKSHITLDGYCQNPYPKKWFAINSTYDPIMVKCIQKYLNRKFYWRVSICNYYQLHIEFESSYNSLTIRIQLNYTTSWESSLCECAKFLVSKRILIYNTINYIIPNIVQT